MGTVLTQNVIDLINDPNSHKVLATVDEQGVPHVVVKDSLRVNEDGYLEYLELIETSRTNKNLVRSIWFHKTISINVWKDETSYEIKGVPYRAIIAGHEFEEKYEQVQKQFGNIDLSTVWLIEATEITDETFEVRRVREEELHPILKHLDRLVVTEE